MSTSFIEWLCDHITNFHACEILVVQAIVNSSISLRLLPGFSIITPPVNGHFTIPKPRKYLYPCTPIPDSSIDIISDDDTVLTQEKGPYCTMN